MRFLLATERCPKQQVQGQKVLGASPRCTWDIITVIASVLARGCRLGEPVEAILSNYPWNGRLLGSRSWVGDIGRIMLAFYGDGLWGEFLLALAKRKK